MSEVIKDRICVDCAMYIAYDALPADSTEEEDNKIINAANRLSCSFKTVAVDLSYDNEFSPGACACCGTTKAGRRLGVNLME